MRRSPQPLATLAVAIALSACAHEAAAAPPVQSPTAVPAAGAAAQAGTAPAVESEAEAIDAARQNPISRPEPRTLYPEQTPPPRPERGLPDQYPPPRDDDRGLPTQSPPPRASDLAPPGPGSQADQPPADLEPAETRVVAPQQPPLAPLAEERPFAPSVDYVWAPGYWYWYGGRYVWISGNWVAPRHGYVYVGARWVYAGDGWEFTPGGWSIGFGSPVAYPVYPHYGLYPRYYGHHRYWNQPHYWSDAHRGYAPERRYDRDDRYEHRYERRHTDFRPAPIQRHTGPNGSSHVVTPRDSAGVHRSGDRIRVYPKRR
jgi:hypothetical protein